jgi:phospholipid transport system substrate-binding protein
MNRRIDLKTYRPLVLLLSLLFGGGAFASAETLTEPQRVVEDVTQGVLQVLRDERDRLRNDPDYVYRLVDELFVPNVDVDAVAALVLGRHWRGATPVQRDAFKREFKRLVIKTYATALNELSLDGWDIIYLPTRDLPGKIKRVMVRTQIQRPGNKPTSVDYSLRWNGRRWLAYDVTVEGVSLLVNYRSSFDRLASEKGMEGLIQDLAARNDGRLGS